MLITDDPKSYIMDIQYGSLWIFGEPNTTEPPVDSYRDYNNEVDYLL